SGGARGPAGPSRRRGARARSGAIRAGRDERRAESMVGRPEMRADEDPAPRAAPAAAPDASDPRSVRRVLSVITLGGNLLGALLTFFYFRFVDVRTSRPPLRPAELAFFAVAFSALVALGFWRLDRWTRPLMDGRTTDPVVRRRAALFPVQLAVVNATNWALAGVLFGVVGPLLLGHFSAVDATRQIFGITLIAGTAATAFVFFAAERRWRTLLPRFFPEGDLRSAPGAVNLPVRARLLALFLPARVIPLALLRLLSYSQATALRAADPADAGALIGGLLVLILFIVVVGIGATVGLALFVAGSVAAPLAEVERAMAEVERGNLAVRCPVVSHDEIGAVTEGFNRMVQGLRERDLVKETFGKYVTREIRDEILGGRVALEGQAREVTILFAD